VENAESQHRYPWLSPPWAFDIMIPCFCSSQILPILILLLLFSMRNCDIPEHTVSYSRLYYITAFHIQSFLLFRVSLAQWVQRFWWIRWNRTARTCGHACWLLRGFSYHVEDTFVRREFFLSNPTLLRVFI
jgi:hypothetical protein